MIFLDTNVLSDTMKPRPDRIVEEWLANHGRELHLSTVALAELFYGIDRVSPLQRSPRWELVVERWRRRLAGRIHEFDEAAAETYGGLMGRASLSGRSMETADGMIAAIALRHGAALATRNVRHFQIEGLRVVDPWNAV
jgi:predicted nucleic acid-binding protein